MKGKYKLMIFFLLCTNGIVLFLMWLQQNSIIRWKKQAKKKAEQYLLMNQWIKLKQEGKNLESYFVKNHYKRIAVVGLGHIGKRLLKELKDSEIQVIYAIERKNKNINSDIKVVPLAARIPNVDAVVVTVIEGFDDVSEILAKKMKCPVIAIEDILNEI